MPVDRWWKYLASPTDDCRGALLDAARNATASLHAIIYAWTLEPLADAFIAAHQRGLEVGIVADRSQSAGHSEHPLVLRLIAAGVPVTITTSQLGKIVHDKVLLVDYALGPMHRDSYVAWGSYNWSGKVEDKASGASGENNVLELSNDPNLCVFLWEQYTALVTWAQEKEGKKG